MWCEVIEHRRNQLASLVGVRHHCGDRSMVRRREELAAISRVASRVAEVWILGCAVQSHAEAYTTGPPLRAPGRRASRRRSGGPARTPGRRAPRGRAELAARTLPSSSRAERRSVPGPGLRTVSRTHPRSAAGALCTRLRSRRQPGLDDLHVESGASWPVDARRECPAGSGSVRRGRIRETRVRPRRLRDTAVVAA